ncbi:hypothetical protein WS46_29465 [Burkholderia sp. RF4-BP95]|nr:hypothetical protein WS46_29465 [Burkholderia sp. RF4-BP95]
MVEMRHTHLRHAAYRLMVEIELSVMRATRTVAVEACVMCVESGRAFYRPAHDMHTVQAIGQYGQQIRDIRVAPAADIARAGMQPACAQQSPGGSTQPCWIDRRPSLPEQAVDDRTRADGRLNECDTVAASTKP